MTGPEPRLFGIAPGTVLLGKYVIEGVLGRGGMGVVMAARHMQLGERVALKLLLPQALSDPDAHARFLQEARAAARIRNEHVVRVFDVGELEGGAPFIAMEYLEGVDLTTRLQTHGRFPVARAVDFVLQACEALVEAHAAGIVHRDLKPAHLFATERSDGSSCIKVLDFGVSKVLERGFEAQDLTKSASVIGSPYYMSPEQMINAKAVDLRTDIWSLGVVLFELVTGERPFQATAVTQLAIKVMNDPPVPLRALLPDAPAALEAVIARCLEKEREARYGTIADLAVALGGLASEDGRQSLARVLGTARRVGAPVTTFGPAATKVIAESPMGAEASGARASAKPWKRPLALGLGLAVLGTLGVVAAVSLHAVGGSGATTSASAAPSTSTAPSTAEEPSPAAASGSSPSHAASTDPSAAPAAPASAPSAASSASATSGPHTRPPAPRVPEPQAPKARGASCDPPFFLDRDGVRHYKPDCL